MSRCEAENDAAIKKSDQPIKICSNDDNDVFSALTRCYRRAPFKMMQWHSQSAMRQSHHGEPVQKVRQTEGMYERTNERRTEKWTNEKGGEKVTLRHCHLHSVSCLLKKTLNKLYWSSILRVVNKWDQHDTFLLDQLRNHPPYTCIWYVIPSSLATRQWSRLWLVLLYYWTLVNNAALNRPFLAPGQWHD